MPKQPCGVKTCNARKSSVSGGKEGNTAYLCRRYWDTYQATQVLATGGANDLKPEKLGRKPLEKGGSCKRIISAGGPSAREANKERNTSQLHRLLC